MLQRRTHGKRRASHLRSVSSVPSTTPWHGSVMRYVVVLSMPYTEAELKWSPGEVCARINGMLDSSVASISPLNEHLL